MPQYIIAFDRFGDKIYIGTLIHELTFDLIFRNKWVFAYRLTQECALGQNL